ncbi:MAG: DegT/DnrJ/EryC1/StrS family aminotransferase [Acidaminobacteraceae bacterium]
MEKIQLLDLKAQYSTIKEEIKVAIDEVLESQHFILGPKVTEFEKNIANYCESKYALGVSSGSDALLLSLMALGVKSGDSVITTPFSFFATAGCISRLGATPIFVDIEENTLNISAKEVRKLLESMSDSEKEKVKAIIPVHIYGQMADMEELMKIRSEYGIKIVEDSAQAIGSECKVDGLTRKSGSIGDIGCYSFFPSKNLGGYGDGGLVVTNDEELYNKMKILRAHGSSPKYYHKYVGGNFRIDAMQASILDVKLKYLDDWTKSRIDVASKYSLGISVEKAITPELTNELDYIKHIYHQYVIRVKNRDKVIDILKDRGISTAIYYPLPLHLQECFEDLGYKKGDFPITETACDEVLALPIYPELGDKNISRIIAGINSI